MHRQVSALGKVLSEQAIGVLVRPALPRALRIAKIYVDFGRQRKATMIRKFLSPVPGQGLVQLLWQWRSSRDRWHGHRSESESVLSISARIFGALDARAKLGIGLHPMSLRSSRASFGFLPSIGMSIFPLPSRFSRFLRRLRELGFADAPAQCLHHVPSPCKSRAGLLFASPTSTGAASESKSAVMFGKAPTTEGQSLR